MCVDRLGLFEAFKWPFIGCLCIQNEWTKVKRDLKNMEEHVKWLELQCQEITESASRKDEENALELANALNASAIAQVIYR